MSCVGPAGCYAWSCESLWRNRPRYFPKEDPALHCAFVSQVIANGLRLARVSFVSNMSMHKYLNVTTDSRTERAAAFLWQNPYRVPIEENTRASARDICIPELLYYELLCCWEPFIMPWWDCAFTTDPNSTNGCVHDKHSYGEQPKQERVPYYKYF